MARGMVLLSCAGLAVVGVVPYLGGVIVESCKMGTGVGKKGVTVRSSNEMSLIKGSVNGVPRRNWTPILSIMSHQTRTRRPLK